MWIKIRNKLINANSINSISIVDSRNTPLLYEHEQGYVLVFHIDSEEIYSPLYATLARAQEVLDALYLALHDSSFNHFDMPEA